MEIKMKLINNNTDNNNFDEILKQYFIKRKNIEIPNEFKNMINQTLKNL